MRILRIAALLCVGASLRAPLHAQQDGLIMLPDTYRVQFENEWVRVVRVHIAGGANLLPHTHPPGLMLHIYLNDAEPVQFNHVGSPGEITRPAVKARSYRIGRATPETHAVVNPSPNASDYLRVELKTQGGESTRRRIAAPPLGTDTATVVESSGEQFRASRITLAAGSTVDVAASATNPALVIALTEGVTVADGTSGARQTLKLGGERFVEAGRTAAFGRGGPPGQVLKIEFLTRPQ